MAYTPTYVGNDLGSIFIDVIGSFAAAIATNAGTLATLVIVGVLAVYGGKAINSVFQIIK